MIRPVLYLERLSLLEPNGKVSYRYGQAARDERAMDYLEFIARVTSRIPDKCGGEMKVVAFIADYQVVDRIIDHLKLTFAAERPPPECVFQDLAMVADPPVEYFPSWVMRPRAGFIRAREGSVGFRYEIGSTPVTLRKSKSLYLYPYPGNRTGRLSWGDGPRRGHGKRRRRVSIDRFSSLEIATGSVRIANHGQAEMC